MTDEIFEAVEDLQDDLYELLNIYDLKIADAEGQADAKRLKRAIPDKLKNLQHKMRLEMSAGFCVPHE